jgi:hypothetical protein
MFGFFNKDKLPKPLKTILAPKKGFTERTRVLFLSAYKHKFGETIPARKFVFATKVLAVILVAFGITGGISVYADRQNVGPKSPLYPLKLYGEVLQLAISKKEVQPDLHIEFAERRLAEVEILKNESVKANEAQIARTMKDFGEDIKASLAAAGDRDYSEERLPKFCRSLDELISTSSPNVKEVLLAQPKITEKFHNQCDKFLSADGGADGSASSSKGLDGRGNGDGVRIKSASSSPNFNDKEKTNKSDDSQPKLDSGFRGNTEANIINNLMKNNNHKEQKIESKNKD